MKSKAYVVTEKEGNQFSGEFEQVEIPELVQGEVLIKTHYSSINYKDYLSAIGNKGVTRNYPHVPGIDLAGVVEQSKSDLIKEGSQVLVTGYDLGMNTDGGWSEKVKVPAEWVVELPTGLSLKQSMVLGTAGFTAAQMVDAILSLGSYSSPDKAKVVVTGASGGVGSVAVLLLHHLGFEVVGLTRGNTKSDFLKKLGVNEITQLEGWSKNLNPKRPMEKGIWHGAIDTVGGEVLTKVIKCMKYHGVVTCCGMVGGPNFTSSVFPFILRGVKLIGVDSAEQPLEVKKELWKKIAQEWKISNLDNLYKEINFLEIPDWVNNFSNGSVDGRIVVSF